jgi:hypothetical protein
MLAGSRAEFPVLMEDHPHPTAAHAITAGGEAQMQEGLRQEEGQGQEALREEKEEEEEKALSPGSCRWSQPERGA